MKQIKAGLVRKPSGPMWTPAELFTGGMQGAWWESTDLTTLFQDTARTTPVTTVGQRVAAISDKSGNANHLLQATLANRPEYRAGHLFFDGVAYWMATSTTPAITQPCALVAAAQIANPFNIIGNIYDSGHATARHILGSYSPTSYRVYGGSTLETPGLTRDANNHVLSATLNGASSTVAVDGVVLITGNGGAGASNSGIVLGVNNTKAANFFSGKYFGGVILNRAITATERGKLYQYFAGKMS